MNACKQTDTHNQVHHKSSNLWVFSSLLPMTLHLLFFFGGVVKCISTEYLSSKKLSLPFFCFIERKRCRKVRMQWTCNIKIFYEIENRICTANWIVYNKIIEESPKHQFRRITCMKPHNRITMWFRPESWRNFSVQYLISISGTSGCLSQLWIE